MPSPPLWLTVAPGPRLTGALFPLCTTTPWTKLSWTFTLVMTAVAPVRLRPDEPLLASTAPPPTFSVPLLAETPAWPFLFSSPPETVTTLLAPVTISPRPVFWSSVEPVRVAVPPETETPLSVFELAVRPVATSVPAVSATPNEAPLTAPLPCDMTEVS